MRRSSEMEVQIQTMQGETVCGSVPVNEPDICIDRILCSIRLNTHEDVQTAYIHLDLRKNEDEWEYRTLAKDSPVKVMLPAEKPYAMTALYMFYYWWSRPAFIDSFADIPAQTQVLLLKYEDHCTCIVPAVGDRWKTTINGGSDDAVCLEMTAGAGGIGSADELLYVLADGRDSHEAVSRAFSWLADYKGIRKRTERTVPEHLRYLGWCSWNAFYTDVDERGIRQKAEELTDKGVPVRWMLIDDGWMSTEGRFLTGFDPDSAKFPDGFGRMIRDIRSGSMINWFGVWHALGGYWDGVLPGTELAQQQAEHLQTTMNGSLVPSYENGAGFYRTWYEKLSSQGISFVKVDGQDAASLYYEDTVPVSEAVRGMSSAMEEGAAVMDNAVINCMGMAMENILSRPASAVSRNSDDFFPATDSFAEHLLQNAYNSIYHDELYCCDWDMFWTDHKYAVKHSLLRAISGGPVYFSDRVGETRAEVLKPLTYSDGRILMMKRSARPTEDCVFTDPVKEGVLKLHNAADMGNAGTGGGIAVFNLTDHKQSFSFAPSDIPELSGDTGHAVYDYFGHKVCSSGEDGRYHDELEAGGFRWYVIVPEGRRVTCLGLKDKYAGFSSIGSVTEDEGQTTIVLRETGSVSWLMSADVSAVICNGTDVTDQVTCIGEVCTLPSEESVGPMTLTFRC